MDPFQFNQSDELPFAISHQGLDRALHCLWGTPERSRHARCRGLLETRWGSLHFSERHRIPTI